MMTRRSTVAIGVLVTMAILELSHPSWAGASVSDGVATAGVWWIPLHLLLITGYAVVVGMLWPKAPIQRTLLALFAVCNTVFLGIDGVLVGLLARADPPTADALWNSLAVGVLGNLTGASWAAALVALAVELYPSRERSAAVVVESSLTWAAFVASSVMPLVGLISRVLAVAIGALAVQATGRAGLPFALLVFAAVLHQHVGSEAALGMLCVAIAVTLRGRSVPVAASPP